VSATAIGLIVFALVFGSALLAMYVHCALPEDQLSTDSKDVVKLGIALICARSQPVGRLGEERVRYAQQPAGPDRRRYHLARPRFGPLWGKDKGRAVCASALVAGAIFLILELDRSFEGLLQVSGAPPRATLAQLGR
jgi:hypothetical protein